MSSPLETVPCKEYLPDVYRFAFLMTGSQDAAAEVVRRTIERATRGGIGDLRDLRRVRRWLFAEARQHCAEPLPAGPLPIVPGGESREPVPAEVPAFAAAVAAGSPADALSTAFGALPERERSALILFYLYLFSPAELAETLDLRPDTLGAVLTHGRALLRREVEKMPTEAGGLLAAEQSLAD